MTSQATIVAVDVGNSAIKIALAQRSDIESGTPSGVEHPHVAFQAFPLTQVDVARRICDWVASRSEPGTTQWWVSSVNHAASRPLEAAVIDAFGDSDLTRRWRAIRCEDLPLAVDVEAPPKVGIDRLLGAYAATVRHEAPVVVVDVGSAVTVDLVRFDAAEAPVFAGGAIFPGVRLQHAALASGTEGLDQPRSRAVFPTDGRRETNGGESMNPARNTEQAIRLGVFAAVAGGIDRLFNEYLRHLDAQTSGRRRRNLPETRMILSGGDGEVVSRFLRSKHELVPGLVCEGLMDLAIERCPNRA